MPVVFLYEGQFNVLLFAVQMGLDLLAGNVRLMPFVTLFVYEIVVI
jgi:hypothetical protein